MSIWTTFLKTLFPSRFNTDGQNLSAILGAIGSVFDELDPNQSGPPGSGTVQVPFVGSDMVHTSSGLYKVQYLINEFNGQLAVWFDGQYWNVLAGGVVFSTDYPFDTSSHTAALTWGSGQVTLTIDGVEVLSGSAIVPSRQGPLGNQFTVSGSSGSYLDLNGNDWSMTRRYGESDSAYRARVLSTIPVYVYGPTLSALKSTVKPFTGVEPLLYTASTATVLFPLTFPFTFGQNSTQDAFTILLKMQNPANVPYQRQDVIDAIDRVKRVIATVTVTWEDGTTTTIQ